MPNANDNGAYKTRGYDNNKIAVTIILVLFALGVIWYGVDHYVTHPTPAVHAAAPASEPVGQGPGTLGRP
jgi:hypothetical protein